MIADSWITMNAWVWLLFRFIRGFVFLPFFRLWFGLFFGWSLALMLWGRGVGFLKVRSGATALFNHILIMHSSNGIIFFVTVAGVTFVTVAAFAIVVW